MQLCFKESTSRVSGSTGEDSAAIYLPEKTPALGTLPVVGLLRPAFTLTFHFLYVTMVRKDSDGWYLQQCVGHEAIYPSLITVSLLWGGFVLGSDALPVKYPLELPLAPV
jgi:hypothetical protein